MKDGVNNLSTAILLVMTAADTSLTLTIREMQRLASRREFEYGNQDTEQLYQDLLQAMAHVNDARYCVDMLKAKVEDTD
jgi:CYTH domain-containing protein